MLEEQVRQLAKQNAGWVVETRRDLHAHPELSMAETRTGALVAEELRRLGLEVSTGWVGTGVVGILKGAHPGKTVMLRADMDALPIQEATGLPFASQTPGVMHACAHDGHVAAMLGVARVLSALRDHLHGTVKFFFQPSEEFNDGAGDAVKQGVLENPKVDHVLGMHLWGSVEKGKIAVRKGPLMASPIAFKISVIGKGGHGALPHTTVDPVAMTVCAINDINYALSRTLSPFDTSVISFCSVHTDSSSYNIIPGQVDLIGTVRTFDSALSDQISATMEKVLAGVVESWGGSYTFEFDASIPPLVNDGPLTERVKRGIEKVAGEQVYDLPNPDMGAEDFSRYACEVPSSYFFVGISEDLANPAIHHNEKFQWDDDVLVTAVAAMSMAALEVLDSDR